VSIGLLTIQAFTIFASSYSKYEMEVQNYGRKGSCFLQFLLVLILLIICLIWVYH